MGAKDIRRVHRAPVDARRTYNRLSRWYDLLADPFEAGARDAGVELLAASPGDVVLDIGSGTGTALVDLGHRVGPDGLALGVDIAEEMCARAAAKIAETDLEQTAVVVGDGTTLPFPDGRFDRAFASFVLELFDTPRLPVALAEWRRVLAPDGTLCVVALSRREVGPAIRIYEWIHARAPHLVDCRPIYVTETIEANGFRVEARREDSVAGLPVDIVLAVPV